MMDYKKTKEYILKVAGFIERNRIAFSQNITISTDDGESSILYYDERFTQNPKCDFIHSGIRSVFNDSFFVITYMPLSESFDLLSNFTHSLSSVQTAFEHSPIQIRDLINSFTQELLLHSGCNYYSDAENSMFHALCITDYAICTWADNPDILLQNIIRIEECINIIANENQKNSDAINDADSKIIEMLEKHRRRTGGSGEYEKYSEKK